MAEREENLEVAYGRQRSNEKQTKGLAERNRRGGEDRSPVLSTDVCLDAGLGYLRTHDTMNLRLE